jgi:hypothetical protein
MSLLLYVTYCYFPHLLLFIFNMLHFPYCWCHLRNGKSTGWFILSGPELWTEKYGFCPRKQNLRRAYVGGCGHNWFAEGDEIGFPPPGDTSPQICPYPRKFVANMAGGFKAKGREHVISAKYTVLPNFNLRRNPPLQLSLWWSTSHPSQSSRSKPSSAAWKQTPSPVSAYWSAWQIITNFSSL